MALFTPPIFLSFVILLTCFATLSKSIPTEGEDETNVSSSTSSSTRNSSLLKTSEAVIEKEKEKNSKVSNGELTEEELSRNGTIRNRLFGLNFDLNIGGRQSTYSSSSYSMAPYHQAIVSAYCRNLLAAISNARLPPTPPVTVIDPVVTVPPSANRPARASSKLPPATEEEENLQIQSRTLHCLRTSSPFRSSDPYSMVLSMCTTVVTTGRWN